MKGISKTIVIQVPLSVTFEAIKEIHKSGWVERYCRDLVDGTLFTTTALSKEVPNSELHYVVGGSKPEERYVIHPAARANKDIWNDTEGKVMQYVLGRE